VGRVGRRTLRTFSRYPKIVQLVLNRPALQGTHQAIPIPHLAPNQPELCKINVSAVPRGVVGGGVWSLWTTHLAHRGCPSTDLSPQQMLALTATLRCSYVPPHPHRANSFPQKTMSQARAYRPRGQAMPDAAVERRWKIEKLSGEKSAVWWRAVTGRFFRWWWCWRWSDDGRRLRVAGQLRGAWKLSFQPRRSKRVCGPGDDHRCLEEIAETTNGPNGIISSRPFNASLVSM
jgi:hypothetical protein